MAKQAIKHSPPVASTSQTSRLRAGGKGLAAVGLVFFALCAFFFAAFIDAGRLYDYQDSVQNAVYPPVDAIVCLAGGRGRVTAAGETWGRYLQQAGGVVEQTPVLYFSGTGQQVKAATLLKQIRPEIARFIPLTKLVIEKESNNTESNAQWLQKLGRQKQWKRILLMTSSYHMRRAQWILTEFFKKCHYPLVIETLSVRQAPFLPGQWRRDWNGVRVSMLEYFKWLYYSSSLARASTGGCDGGSSQHQP